MRTIDDLAGRVRLWSAGFAQNTTGFAAGRSPIVAYQLTYGLIHDLKSSLALSSTPELRSESDRVLRMDVPLRRLATDELELASTDNVELVRLGSKLGALDPLGTFLKGALARAVTPPKSEPPKTEHSYPWESFSRARAASCSRHGYSFREQLETMPLLALTIYDKRLRERLALDGGLLVARAIEPSQAELRVTDLIAFPGVGSV